MGVLPGLRRAAPSDPSGVPRCSGPRQSVGSGGYASLCARHRPEHWPATAPESALCVTIPSSGLQRRSGLTRGIAIIGRWGHRQNLADGLDPVVDRLRIDQRLHRLNWRSRSTWAKNRCLAQDLIGLAQCTTSRSSALIRCRSSLLRPGRCPLSHAF